MFQELRARKNGEAAGSTGSFALRGQRSLLLPQPHGGATLAPSNVKELAAGSVSARPRNRSEELSELTVKRTLIRRLQPRPRAALNPRSGNGFISPKNIWIQRGGTFKSQEIKMSPL